MTDRRKRLGTWGEDQAEAYLREKGWSVVERNWRIAQGEIDLICWDRRTLVFVEVRTRSSEKFGTPLESVDWRKRKKLRELALRYLQQSDIIAPTIRFDIVSVSMQRTQGTTEIRHLPHAF